MSTDRPEKFPYVVTTSSVELPTPFERAVIEKWTELILLGPIAPSFHVKHLQLNELRRKKRIYHCKDSGSEILLNVISSLTNLTSLHVGFNSIGDEGARAIASLTNLTSLDVGFSSIGDEGARAITSLTNLTSLHVAGNDIGDEGVRAISS